MTEIPDDPIIRCMERTGYPPWFQKKRRSGREGGDDSPEDENGRAGDLP